VGCLFAYLNYRSYWRRLAFIGLATLVPIIANGLRAFGIIMIGHYSNMKLAVGVDHIIYGWIFFGVVILLLFWFGSLWQEPVEQPSSTAAEPKDLGTDRIGRRPLSIVLIGSVLVGAVVAMAIGPVGSAWLAHDVGDSTEITLRMPSGNQEWGGPMETDDAWQPQFEGPKEELHKVYVRENAVVHVFVIHYRTQTQGSELIGSGNHIYDGKRWRRASEERRAIETAGGKSLEVIETIMNSGSTNRLVWHWYDIAGHQTAGTLEGKLWEAWARLTDQRSGSSLIMVAVDYELLPDESRHTLGRFLASFPSLTKSGELIKAR
jgi:EpsI family protein